MFLCLYSLYTYADTNRGYLETPYWSAHFWKAARFSFDTLGRMFRTAFAKSCSRAKQQCTLSVTDLVSLATHTTITLKDLIEELSVIVGIPVRLRPQSYLPVR
jgi:hypothetical protein